MPDYFYGAGGVKVDDETLELFNGVLRVKDRGITTDKINTQPSYIYSTNRSDIYVSDDTAVSASSSSYTLLKKFTFPSDFPSNTMVRVYFERLIYVAAPGYIQVRVWDGNTETTIYTTSSPSDWGTVELDVTVSANYEIRIYGRYTDSSYKPMVRNYRILGTSNTMVISQYSKYNITT